MHGLCFDLCSKKVRLFSLSERFSEERNFCDRTESSKSYFIYHLRKGRQAQVGRVDTDKHR